jgi:hypothetical protein
MIDFSSVLQMGAHCYDLVLQSLLFLEKQRLSTVGIQSLLALFGGWACSRWRVLEAEPTVKNLNLFILKFCIPCLQLWLLAVKTNMQSTDNWW